MAVLRAEVIPFQKTSYSTPFQKTSYPTVLEALISSKTRIKLLLRLFLNPGTTAHLRGLADEFDESTNSVRLELNRFEEAGMLTSENQGNKKLYRANHQHPLFKDLNSILLKYIGIDRIIATVIEKLGDLEIVYLTGDYAIGKDSSVIDLIFVGNVNRAYLANLVEKAERIIGKKIRYILYQNEEWVEAPNYEPSNMVLLWRQSKSGIY